MPSSSTRFNKIAKNATKYGLRRVVTMIPGDGIGKELCKAVETVFGAARVPLDFEKVQLSGYDSSAIHLQQAIDSLKRNKIGLKGIIYTPPTGPQTSLNVALRHKLDLYANVVHIKNLSGCFSRHPVVDFVIIRENTEGEYSGLDHTPILGVVESLKVTTREKSKRICQYAFDYARKNGRSKVTCVHKANIMKLTDGLFLKTFEEVAAVNSDIKTDSMIVDNTAMQMVSNPTQFDVIVTPNLYGNILSNIGAGLVGSAGLIPGYNMGTDYAIFEPGARHVAKDIEGRNTANPVSMLLSSVSMLKHISLDDYAKRIESAVLDTLSSGSFCTPDIAKGESTTSEFINEILSKLGKTN